MDPLDLSRYRRQTDGTPAPAKPQRLPPHKAGEWFVQAMPGRWLGRAAQLPGKALHVGLAVWYAAGLAKSRRARLTGKTMAMFGIRRDAGYRGLKRLEEAGLVSVDRHRGRCPVVTILDRPTEND